MLPVKQAESLILDLIHPLNSHQDIELVNLFAASGRILAASVTSSLDFPHWDNSAMDGYAVQFADVKMCSAANPVTLKIIEEIPAGYQPQCTLQPGEAARIFTGACLPSGADTIVMQEETQREGNFVRILAAPQPHAFIRQKAAFYQAGTPLLTPGIPLNAPEIAVLAAAQCTEIPVYRRLRVAIFSTGDELVTPEQPLKPGQLVDSNQYALAAAIAQMGAEPIRLGIVPDNPDALKSVISQALAAADVVISTGGVSVGDYDYVEKILETLGGEIPIRSVAIKPGKPLTVATFSHNSPPQIYFGLPGNPVSTLVTFWRFVQPALNKLAGLYPEAWGPTFVQARSRQLLQSDGKRETYLWGELNLVEGVYEFQLASGSHNSGNLINLANTTGLAVLPIPQTLVSANDWVQVLKIS